MIGTELHVTHDDARLRVVLSPAAGRPTLVLLHGITDGAATWGRVAERLAGCYSLVMPDARGHGGSSRITGSIDIETLVDDAAAVLDHLATGRVLVWGHSMGAETAARLAGARPDLVRAAVLEDPPFHDAPPAEAAGGDDDPHLAAFVELLHSVGDMTPEQRMAMARASNPGWHDDELAPWADTKADFDTSALTLLDGGLGRDWRAAVAAIACPTLLVTGDAGAIVTPEVAAEAAALAPAARVVRIDGAGHSVHRDRFDATVAAVTAFLRDVVAD
ncbi:alpha/beta hydrolase [Demequina sp. SYSU T00068]|uniref:alpha/beta fold hydrolase n=1 Tax=Demequina lignilytica TaxID=3051663 RepID=UPI0026082795|nr:alpha/beta hydrolase [Demequina sp. SYSU T00068]MDN4491781.1 alpha/beta hydrolase [Demequina sp. SYSU T00068]